jgi:hypothetical protein
MSVIGSLVFVPTVKLDELRGDPDGIVAFLQPEDRELYDDPSAHCVEDNWSGMHYLLNGCGTDAGEPPLDFFICGGEPISDVDLGYGPARAFTATELADVVRALGAITDDMLRERFDAPAMDRAGVHGWETDDREDLVRQTRELITYLRDGAGRNDRLLIWFD